MGHGPGTSVASRYRRRLYLHLMAHHGWSGRLRDVHRVHHQRHAGPDAGHFHDAWMTGSLSVDPTRVHQQLGPA